ncbi:MAG: hypothetical protein GY940_24355 [bacterium]|nr:hypothetical protein [bacterium]
MWTTIIEKLVIIVTAAALSWGAAQAPPLLYGQEKEITYGKEESLFHRQKLSVFKSPGQISASDLRPEVTLDDSRFFYSYPFTRDTPLRDIPLRFFYRDGSGAQLMGNGWRISYTFQFETEHETPVLSPLIPLYKNKTGWFLLWETEEIPLQQEQDTEPGILTTKQSYNGSIYRFKMSDCGDEPTALPYRVTREDKQGEEISFSYRFTDQSPRLEQITQGQYVLVFRYSRGRLDHIRLSRETGEIGSRVLKQWQMEYDTPKSEAAPYLSAINHDRHHQHRQEQDASPRKLTFSYAISEPSPLSMSRKTARVSSAWKLRQGNIRFMLPDRHMSIRNIPGLRIMDINQDHHPDVIDTTFRRMRTWIANPGSPGYWLEFSHSYKPPVPLVKYGDSKRLMGSVYSSLAKVFRIYQYNTHKFQSVITSYYRPTPDGKGLNYTGLVYFPRVRNSLDPDPSGYCWRPDDHELLRLPVPLQYEGKRPWPVDRPGIAAIERAGGTGAQFVDFTRDGRLNLFYIGLRYRDARTGEVLLAKKNESWFRDTGNCREWYETTWSNLGKTRKVKVDLCQAFWKTRKKFWDERYPQQYPGKPFWRRMDLNRDGTPNSKYILPWQEDARRYFHYDRFRNVSFTRLNRYFPAQVFAVIHGRGCATCKPAVPAVTEIYRLIPGLWKWRKVKPGSDFYPPAEFFDRYDGVFADINGDRIDDALIAAGSYRKTYINTGQPGNPWLDSPAHYLPRECDLGNGGCQLLNLDRDRLVDLFTGNGSRVYLNGTPARNRKPYHGYMSAFTDEKGKQKQVDEIKSN